MDSMNVSMVPSKKELLFFTDIYLFIKILVIEYN